jgi:exonuclease III
MTRINILQHNIRSLRSNKDELDLYLIENDIQMILLSETWSKESDNFVIRNYKVMLNHGIGGYRGVGIIYHDSLHVERIEMELDLVVVEILIGRLCDLDVFVISIYVPEENIELIRADLVRVLAFCDGKKVIFGGDFNAHHEMCGSSKCDQKGRLVTELINDSNLLIVN